MRIVKLEAENVKRLRAVTITPNGAIVEIRGANGAGKTSVLDSIAYVLGGEKLCPAEPIRRGTDNARATLEMDEDLVAERRWTRGGGSRLEVRSKDGRKYPSPQKLLDGLVGKLSFDPLAFLREKPERQAEILRELVGVDFTLLDTQRKKAFDTRTDVNREVASLRARLEATPAVEAPDEVVSAADLLAEQERRRAIQDANEAKRRELASTREKFKAYEEEISEHKIEIAQLERALADKRARLAECEKYLGELRTRGAAFRAEVDALRDPDMEEIPTRIRELETINERVRQKRTRATLIEQLRASESAAHGLTVEIEAVDRQKEEALASAAFPVPGLAFTDRGVTLGGLPLAQASSAEQLRVSVAMGIALNPKLRVLLVRDGSLLDETSLRLLSEMAEKSGAQVWLEVVGKGGVGVVIEDGQVEVADQPKVKEIK